MAEEQRTVGEPTSGVEMVTEGQCGVGEPASSVQRVIDTLIHKINSLRSCIAGKLLLDAAQTVNIGGMILEDIATSRV